MIDAFSHFLPKPVLNRFRQLAPQHPAVRLFDQVPELWDIEARLRSLDGFPELQQVLNFGNPPIDTFAEPAVAAQLARLANTEMAELCAVHPDRFPAFTAVLPLQSIDLALEELEYAHEELGARGIQLFTNVLGQPLSSAQFRPIFSRMADLDLPVLVHPYRTAEMADYANEVESKEEVWFTFGWPYETSAFAARMVFSGIFQEYPDVKIVLHHFGAMLPSFAKRLELGFQQIFSGVEAANPVAVKAGLAGPVIDHYRRFYADTALNGWVPGLRAGYEFFGSAHSLLGTDAPFSPDGGRSFVADTIAGLAQLDMDEKDRQQVLHGNAQRLFRLHEPSIMAQSDAAPAPLTGAVTT